MPFSKAAKAAPAGACSGTAGIVERVTFILRSHSRSENVTEIAKKRGFCQCRDVASKRHSVRRKASDARDGHASDYGARTKFSRLCFGSTIASAFRVRFHHARKIRVWFRKQLFRRHSEGVVERVAMQRRCGSRAASEVAGEGLT